MEEIWKGYHLSELPLGRRIIEGIEAVVIWCLCAGFLVGISFGLYYLDPPDPDFETKRECNHALFELQYKVGHHWEECLELENGHWKIFDIEGNAL